MKTITLFPAVFALALGAGVQADPPKDPATDRVDAATVPAELVDPKPATAPLSDTEFYAKAASGGLTEVILGEMAMKKGASEDVRELGERMVGDHTKNNADLAALAGKRAVELPKQPNAEHQALIADLTVKSGIAFDRAYAQAMVKAHQDKQVLLQQIIAQTKDMELRAFAEATLATVKQHLSHAEQISAEQVASLPEEA